VDDPAPREPSDTGETALVPGFVGRRDPITHDPSLSRGALLGRYLVVGEAGQGGMGVVVRAYDPKLRREVALKRLRLASGSAHAHAGALGLLREARAMARLAHPNVLAVYDVEEIEGRSYLVMEYVEGTTLHEWIGEGGRPWREALALLVQAGRGLAAAHAVGLVHRDFKPNNVLIGLDPQAGPGNQARARVMDFGLARGADEGETSYGSADASGSDDDMLTAGEVLGTPAYMAPEQHVGLLADARADQYAWCVTLWEALAGRRPFIGNPDTIAAAKRSGAPPMPPSAVPRWLIKVIERGLAPSPDDRFASMDLLLVEIERGTAHARRRKAVLASAALVAVALGGWGLHVLDQRDRARACVLEGERITELWNDDARGMLRDALVATGVGYAEVTADKVMPWIDAQASAWQQARTEVCEQGERSDDDGVARALWCLDERRMELDALVAELSRADARVVHKAVQAAAGLTQISTCRDPQLLARLPPPPTEHQQALQDVRAELSRAAVLERAGKYDAARELAARALDRATALGWPPLIAAAQQRLGFVLERSGAYAEAEAELETAFFAAANAGAIEVQAASADKLLFTVGLRLARHDDGLRWGRHAEVALAALGETEGLRIAGHLDKLAIVHAARGDYDEAEALHERALALKIATLGEDHPDVASSLNNLAAVHQSTAAWAKAKPLHERALAIREQTLGPDHPDVAMSLANLGVVADATGDYAAARRLHERALAIRERALGPEHPEVAATLNNLANVREAMGDHAEAAALFERALVIQERELGPEHPEVATSLANLALVRVATGDLRAARALQERALAIREKALGPDHPEVAASLDNLGLVLAATGDLAGAKALHERAVSIRERVLGAQHPDLASSLNNLASVQARLGAHVEAAALFERARAIRERARAEALDTATR
jgi:eukaryotic-like serine/threonine-protein kinase